MKRKTRDKLLHNFFKIMQRREPVAYPVYSDMQELLDGWKDVKRADIEERLEAFGETPCVSLHPAEFKLGANVIVYDVGVNRDRVGTIKRILYAFAESGHNVLYEVEIPVDGATPLRMTNTAAALQLRPAISGAIFKT